MGKRRHTTKATRMRLYAASSYLNLSTEKELGLQIPFDVYLQDPYVSENDPLFGFDEGSSERKSKSDKGLYVRWEPGLADGPTSSRFAVVDYNGDTGRVAPKARWDAENEVFRGPDDKPLDRENFEPLQFHQVNVWAVLQRALDFYEGGNGLGRPIPYGFEGNRLIVVPHAGYGRNAFYDRVSKSLQFYYFDDGDNRVYTCLSADIVNHEFGHAVLDGVRPYLLESSLVETGAFHEYVADMTAILIILRNNDFRHRLVEATKGDLSAESHLSRIAEEFGEAVSGKPYLRTALNKKTMSDVAGEGPHGTSQVLTGAMFEILVALSKHYIEHRGRTAKQAFWDAIQRMQRMAIQPLDLLPPVDVTFRDYALAVLRADELTNPTDPHDYFEIMLQAFHKREILDDSDLEALREPRYLYERPRLSVFHAVEEIGRSRASAYRFLDDNRQDLLIPANQNLVVADLYHADKMSRLGSRLPRQLILEYIWREEIVLEGERFEEYEGERTTMLCGGTLVFDEHGNMLSWSRKPGTERDDGKRWDAEAAAGAARKEALLNDLAGRIGSGQIGAALGSSKGLLGTHMPTVTVRREGGALRFELSPHLSLSGDDHEHYEGGRQWEPSS